MKHKHTPSPVAPTAAEKTAAEQIAEAYAPRPQARMVQMAQRESPALKSARERALAGQWRLTHTSMPIATPRELIAANPDLPPSFLAKPGDVVWLDDVDAAFCLDNDLVEPPDASPSRVGKVWENIQTELGWNQDGRPTNGRTGQSWDFAKCEALKNAREAKNRRASK
ncbi:MAG: hypothetical protein WBY94_18670 [Polyangiaceae bacterium]